MSDLLTFLAPDNFQTPKQNAPVPITAYKVPKPNAFIAKADPSSNKRTVFRPPCCINLLSLALALPNVREKPNKADIPPTNPKKSTAAICVIYRYLNLLSKCLLPSILYFFVMSRDALGSLIFVL